MVFIIGWVCQFESTVDSGSPLVSRMSLSLNSGLVLVVFLSSEGSPCHLDTCRPHSGCFG